jgi:hypothetical protein
MPREIVSVSDLMLKRKAKGSVDSDDEAELVAQEAAELASVVKMHNQSDSTCEVHCEEDCSDEDDDCDAALDAAISSSTRAAVRHTDSIVEEDDIFCDTVAFDSNASRFTQSTFVSHGCG